LLSRSISSGASGGVSDVARSTNKKGGLSPAVLVSMDARASLAKTRFALLPA
jgi:hypothetical protein